MSGFMLIYRNGTLLLLLFKAVRLLAFFSPWKGFGFIGLLLCERIELQGRLGKKKIHNFLVFRIGKRAMMELII
jgi:hypothetical protein